MLFSSFFEKKKKKVKTTSNDSSNDSFNTGDVVLRKMSKDLQVQTDGVVVCFFGNFEEGKETSNQQVNLKNVDYFSKKKKVDFATMKAKYKELFKRDVAKKCSKDKKWIMKKIKEEDPDYSCPLHTDADADKKALIHNHNSAFNGIQVTFDGEKMNNDNVEVVGNIYNKIIHQKTSFGSVDVTKSLVFYSFNSVNLAADEDYNACILVPYGKTTINNK